MLQAGLHLFQEIRLHGIVDIVCQCLSLLSQRRESQIKFVVFPSPRGGYNLHTVPMSLSGRTQRIPLPEKWFTKPDDYKADKDKNYSEVIKEENDGLIFWNRAFACFETKEQAFRAARKFINDYEANEAVDSLEHLVTSVQDL